MIETGCAFEKQLKHERIYTKVYTTYIHVFNT